MPGFWEVPRAVALLPADVMRWSKLVHGGARDGSLRVFAVPGTDDTRADHAIEHADGSGRFVCLLYGPRWRECRQVRPAELHLEQDFGDVGRLVIGRV
jgi:hypothetical protein